MPYAIDLVRLATSVCLAIEEDHLTLLPEDACKAILKGYQEALSEGGRPFVLAEKYPVLRAWATARLRDPGIFWDKINSQPNLEGDVVPPEVHDVLRRYLPEPGLSYRVVHRIAGLGSLGRQRFVALAQWRGGSIAREAKALVPSAWTWQQAAATDGDLLRKGLDDGRADGRSVGPPGRAVDRPPPLARLPPHRVGKPARGPQRVEVADGDGPGNGQYSSRQRRGGQGGDRRRSGKARSQMAPQGGPGDGRFGARRLAAMAEGRDVVVPPL